MSHAVKLIWFEPACCSTSRGWARISAATHPDRRHAHFDYSADCCCLLGCGNYLDYGPLTTERCGNYLDYGPLATERGPNGEAVHAVAYVHRMHNELTDAVSRADLGCLWCATIQEAKDWIESRVREHLAE